MLVSDVGLSIVKHIPYFLLLRILLSKKPEMQMYTLQYIISPFFRYNEYQRLMYMRQYGGYYNDDYYNR